MTEQWDIFFNLQQQALKVAFEAGETDVFGATMDCFAKEFELSHVTWEMQISNDMWRTMFEWDIGTPQQGSQHVVLMNDEERKHRFIFTAAPSTPLESPHMRALAQTAKLVVEMHNEHTMQLADARGGASELGHATVDNEGHIISADERFQALIRRADPDWDGRKFPMPLDLSPNSLKHGLTWKGLFFYVDTNAVQIYLRARPDRRRPDLSPRELEVARLIGSGMTFKEVARVLDMAPSTASTHLYKAYDKIGISRRSALVEWLSEHDQAS